MKIKQLEKATKVFEKIQKLDKEINELDKLALLIVNNKTDISFELKIENCNDNETTPQVEIDSDGSLSFKVDFDPRTSVVPWPLRFTRMDFGAISNTPNKNTKSLKNKLTETPTLQILGVLLGEKQRERQSLLMQLKSYGVAI